MRQIMKKIGLLAVAVLAVLYFQTASYAEQISQESVIEQRNDIQSAQPAKANNLAGRKFIL